jgi:hypothetical protein
VVLSGTLLEKGFFQTKLIPFPEQERAFPGRATWHVLDDWCTVAAWKSSKHPQQVAPSAAFRFTAWEAQMGLHMVAGQETSYMISPNDSDNLSR